MFKTRDSGSAELTGEKGKTREKLQKVSGVISFSRGRTKAEGLCEWGTRGVQTLK